MAENENGRRVGKAIDDDVRNVFQLRSKWDVMHVIPPDCSRAALKREASLIPTRSGDPIDNLLGVGSRTSSAKPFSYEHG
jgi:hypothetical protein